MSFYDVYGKMAKHNLSATLQAGRLSVQSDAEKNIPGDVISKLELSSNDSLLDIGCGTGLILIPASKIVKEAHACDHPHVLDKIQDDKIIKHPGNFADLEFNQKFTKIVVYSVLHCLPDEDTLMAFIKKVVSLLDPKGICLFGDVPNADMKRRFLNSERGKVFQKEWEDICKSIKPENSTDQFRDESAKSVHIDDKVIASILAMLREEGFQAHTVKQPQNMPFGNTREDILLYGPEYEDRG